MADNQSTSSPDAVRDALLKAIKRGAERYDPGVQSAGMVRDLAEAYAFVLGTRDSGPSAKGTAKH
ncbi:hypothetical protein [Micromonospora haikouensis]|uniref:Uncharacterized protein n=1 Tax=Micromonospora haikouensis TaxID=686309 RepID=A0A0D0X1Z4_9ACTN|nr:hypothetical protein [Micromonospora haikouensis]KIR64954.1 hypothetical protein TK50_05275 [Micromonospora haikouensis]